MVEIQLNGTGPLPVMTSSEAVASKRQRRPSVRLGDIGGDYMYDSQVRRSVKQWRQHQLQDQASIDNRKSLSPSGKGSKTRALTNLSSCGREFNEIETLDGDKEGKLDTVAIGSWRVKDSKRRSSVVPTTTRKRVRSNWVSSRIDPSNDDNSIINNNDDNGGDSSEEDNTDNEDRDFDREDLDSPLEEHSPIDTPENPPEMELSGPSDTTEGRKWRNDRLRARFGENGVRPWLNSLGLGRYSPVFEIHEVDDEVLPLLTMEDLKDMGINAVGSRRKLYCAIQKLSKRFS